MVLKSRYIFILNIPKRSAAYFKCR